MGRAGTARCVVDSQGLQDFVHCSSKPPMLLHDMLNETLREQSYWLHLGLRPHQELAEFVEWKRRDRNKLADAMCHMAQRWRTSILMISEPVSHSQAWHSWSDGGYDAEKGEATCGAVIYRADPVTGRASLAAAFALYQPVGINGSLDAETCALSTVHKWLSALQENRLTPHTVTSMTTQSPNHVILHVDNLVITSLPLKPF